jgi:TATA-binding protein-associated factor Taf7
MHLQGATAFAARQAAVWRQLAVCFRHSWWNLSDKVGGAKLPASSDSSGVDERDGTSGSEDSGDGGGWEDDEVLAQEAAVSGRNEPRTAEDEGGPEEEEGEEESEGEAGEEEEDIARRTAKMDELLAIQSTSLSQYDKL